MQSLPRQRQHHNRSICFTLPCLPPVSQWKYCISHCHLLLLFGATPHSHQSRPVGRDPRLPLKKFRSDLTQVQCNKPLPSSILTDSSSGSSILFAQIVGSGRLASKRAVSQQGFRAHFLAICQKPFFPPLFALLVIFKILRKLSAEIVQRAGRKSGNVESLDSKPAAVIFIFFYFLLFGRQC